MKKSENEREEQKAVKKLRKTEKKEQKYLRKLEKIKNRKFYGRTSLVSSGIVTGATLGGLSEVLYTAHGSIKGFGIGAIIGLLFSLIVGNLIKNKSERLRMQIQYGVCGLVPGYMILGNPFLIRYSWGAIVGAILFATLFAFVIAPFLYKKKTKGRYLSFPGEGGLFTVFGLVVSYAGDEIAGLINGSRLFNTAKKVVDLKAHGFTTVMIAKKGIAFTIVKACIGFIVPFLLIMVAYFWIGFALAANKRRPVFGATLAIIGGAEISFIGFKVAPMLFVPGSGMVWVGLIDGLLIIAMAITAIYYSLLRVPLGVVVIVLSVLSYVGAAGGLIFGGLLGIFGGAMITAWQDPESVSSQKPNPMQNQIPPSPNVTV